MNTTNTAEVGFCHSYLQKVKKGNTPGTSIQVDDNLYRNISSQHNIANKEESNQKSYTTGSNSLNNYISTDESNQDRKVQVENTVNINTSLNDRQTVKFQDPSDNECEPMVTNSNIFTPAETCIRTYDALAENVPGLICNEVSILNKFESSSLDNTHQSNALNESSISRNTTNMEEFVNTTCELESTDVSYNDSNVVEDNILIINNAVDSYKTIQTFFSETERISKTLTIDKFDLEMCNVTSVLRPYQRATVDWMLMRECKCQEIRLNEWNITLPLGGVLADEMGLGKTVEVLACILSHKRENPHNICNATGKTQILQQTTRKRKSLNNPLEASFLKKKPHLSSIKQNRTLKNEIGGLLKEYFLLFQQRVLRKKTEQLSEKCKNFIQIGFKIILLNRFYNHTQHQFTKQQIWGYLVSVFDVNEEFSVGYSILQKEENKKNEKISTVGPLCDEEVIEIIFCVNEFLNMKMIKKFEKDFNIKLHYSLRTSWDGVIPLLENENVRCKCGSDKANGKKIECAKCGTLQHLTCVGLENRGPDASVDSYYCPSCWMDEPPIESSSTLIVVPTTLAKQWEDEIMKHASDCNLSVYCYGGLKKNYVVPPLLAAYDIVLVTADVLRAEFSFLTNQTRALRHVKRYHSFVTPLTCISWWRLCIDEAQMVEGANKISEMASLIKCVHLWAITGTPIGKSLNDLYGLTTYLRIKPFTESFNYWQTLLLGDQSSLHMLFAYIMRRKTKDEIYEQLQLPKLSVETTWLSFPPTEGFFYNSTHSISQKTFMQKINNIKNLDQPLKKANRRTVEGVLAPLLSLRQACVHPQAAPISANLFNLRNYETMEQLLEKMIKKTKVDCDDALRLYVMFVNGAASVHAAAQNYKDAVTLYRSVLAKKNIYNNLTADNFQMIHVMHNLYESALKDNSIELTMEEKEFPQRIEELEKKCLERKQEMVEAMKQQITQHSNAIKKTLGKFELKCFDWWQNMLERINFSDLLPRILNDLDTGNIDLAPDLKFKLSSANRLTEALRYWLSDVEQKRNLTYLFLEQITSATTTENLWIAAENCHIRKSEPTKSCLLCRMENVMLKYEALLFNVSNKNEGFDLEGKANPIDWKMSAYECILNVLLTCSRTYGLSASDNTNASAHLKIFGFLKREFKAIRGSWTRQCDLLHVYDEIRVAKCNFDVTAENMFQAVVDSLTRRQLEAYQEQSTAAYVQLQSKYGSLQYLKNLEKRYTNGENKEEGCPVCHNSIEEKRAVMTCGHFTCYGCMQALLEHSVMGRIQCPICRAFAPLCSITCVYGGGTTDYDISEVKGNYSIKVLAITAKVLHLRQQDPKVKILIFSTWKRVFDVIEKAFNENRISFRKFGNGEQRKISLSSFKDKDYINVLLMPLHSGSKGLNLTEAAHVIFTDPVLNLADEKQAIGRIYRLGQSKNMTVHKFVIRGTIEEHIYRMNMEVQNEANSFELTFKHLRNLFEASSSSDLM